MLCQSKVIQFMPYIHKLLHTEIHPNDYETKISVILTSLKLQYFWSSVSYFARDSGSKVDEYTSSQIPNESFDLS